MNIHYTARQTEVTPEIEEYCEKRLGRMKELARDVLEIHIVLAVEKNRHKAEIQVKAKGGGLVVVEETMDMMNSLKRVFDSLEKKIKKEREKWREKKRRGGREKRVTPAPAETPEPEKRIVRSQSYSLKPMSLDEAVIQLEVKNREIFVYRREGSEKWAVVYRRRDGNIGLVEPE
jgi:putative sigma-54 modulation protein